MWTNIKELQKNISEGASSLGLPEKDFKIEHPQTETFGDFATNVAMITWANLTLEQKKIYPNPRALATAIAEKLDGEVAGPGFINFRYSNTSLLNNLDTILSKGQEYGKTEDLKTKKVSVEYTDPNPFKELHLGHLYSNLIGEALAKIMEANGATVWRADFYGDTGLHVAKSVWGMRIKLKEENLSVEQLQNQSISQRQNFLGKCYAFGVNQYEGNENAKEEITHLNTLIHAVAQELHIEQENWKPVVDYNAFVNAPEFDREEIKKLYKNGLAWSLEYFESLYKLLGTKFDGYYPESKVGEIGYSKVMNNIKEGLYEKSDGAVIYPGEKYGLHTRVFINKLGLPTYEAKDTGLAFAKYNDFPYDLSYNVTGSEIREYFKVVFHALKKVDPKLGNATHAITHGMVTLPEGKMSSRTGNVITVENLLNKAKEEARNIITNDKLDETEKDNVARVVGMAAVKYALLKANIGNDVVFDFNESVSFNGKSGPYLQYTYARCSSVLEKDKMTQKDIITTHDTKELNNEELALLRWLIRFPEVIRESSLILSTHLICEYLYELAQRYNSFYNKHQICGNKLRLNLTLATKHVIKNGLHILGIECPERM